jgi:hypothetical protein
VQQLQTTRMTAEPPPAFRLATLLVGAAIVLIELGLFWIASRLVPVSTVEGSAHKDLLTVFIVFWTLLTLQAMGAVAIGWLLVALGRTRLTVAGGRISVEHPWRSWHGAGDEVAELYTSRGWLHIRTRGSLRTWHVRGGDHQRAIVAVLEGMIPADARLTARAARRLMVARTVGPWLVVLALGVLGFSFLQQWLNSLR